jgi:hypothetical protein
MDANEIAVQREQRHRMRVVLGLLEAFAAASSARFEHGEQPAILATNKAVIAAE